MLLNIPENDELEKLKMEIGKLNQHRSELVARLTEIKQVSNVANATVKFTIFK